MMKTLVSFTIGTLSLFMQKGFGQNVGIGGAIPTRARLEVAGAFGTGSTSGLFAGDQGISVQRNYAAIGFNQYNPDVNSVSRGRYMGNGFAATMVFRHDDLTYANGLEVRMAPSGVAEGAIPSETMALAITPNGSVRFRTAQIPGGAILQVGRGTGFSGTAMFSGTSYSSHFNFSTAEHTYIRAGVSTGSVLLHPHNGGKVVLGNTASRVGINAPDPQYPLEFRQVAETGLLIRNGEEANSGFPWEWRVIGTTGVFSLRHNNGARGAFSPSNGAYAVVSDERLKTDMQALPDIMQKILLLRPVTYVFTSNNPNQVRTLGLIAQEVEPIFPELVDTNDADGQNTKMMQYSGFGVLAIKGVQEQQGLLNALTATSRDMENRIQALRTRQNLKR